MLVIGLGLLVAPRAASADHARCALDVHGHELPARWARAVAAIQRALADRDDVDRCAEIDVTVQPGGARIVAALPDGRIAVREVAGPDELEPTLLALLLVPPAAAREAPVAALDSARRPEPVSELQAATAIAPPSAAAVATAPAARGGAAGARFDLGLSTGAQWQGAVAVAAGGFAEVSLGRWLVGASGRWSRALRDAPDETIDRPDAPLPAPRFVQAFEVGAELGLRGSLGAIELAAIAGPRVALVSGSVAMRTNEGTLVTGSSEGFAARVGAAIRAGWVASPRLRLALELDASFDIGDRRADRPVSGMLEPAPELPRSALSLSFAGQFRVSP
jgi:hypothetical protein